MIAESRLTQEQQAIVARLERLVATGYSLLRMQGISGVPKDSIAAYLKGHYPPGYRHDQEKNNAEAFAKLETFLRAEEQADSYGNGYATTPTYQAIHAHMELAIAANLIVAITGGVGIGKSEAAKSFVAARARSQRNPGAVRVEFRDTDNQRPAVLARIHSAVIGTEYTGNLRGGSATVMQAAIEAALRPGDCLILDECNYLGDAIDVVRSIYDHCKIPIVMIGNPDFGRGIFGKESRFEALANRTIRRDFPKTTEDDVDAWLDWAGLSGADLRRTAIKLACRAGSGGGLRTLALAIKLARVGYPGYDLDASLVASIAADIGRGVQ